MKTKNLFYAMQILKEEKLLNFKRSLDVEISWPISRAGIQEIANHLFKPNYDRTFMLFYLPSQTPGAGAYASCNWIGNKPEVKIYG